MGINLPPLRIACNPPMAIPAGLVKDETTDAAEGGPTIVDHAQPVHHAPEWQASKEAMEVATQRFAEQAARIGLGHRTAIQALAFTPALQTAEGHATPAGAAAAASTATPHAHRGRRGRGMGFPTSCRTNVQHRGARPSNRTGNCAQEVFVLREQGSFLFALSPLQYTAAAP